VPKVKKKVNLRRKSVFDAREWAWVVFLIKYSDNEGEGGSSQLPNSC
jgi:hypothetical protein